MWTHYLKDEIFRALARNPYGLTTEQLIAEVYRGNEPDSANGCIHVTIYRIRKMALPYTIKWVRYRHQLFFT